MGKAEFVLCMYYSSVEGFFDFTEAALIPRGNISALSNENILDMQSTFSAGSICSYMNISGRASWGDGRLFSDLQLKCILQVRVPQVPLA